MGSAQYYGGSGYYQNYNQPYNGGSYYQGGDKYHNQYYNNGRDQNW
jgi:hypothetical protein